MRLYCSENIKGHIDNTKDGLIRDEEMLSRRGWLHTNLYVKPMNVKEMTLPTLTKP